MKQHITSEQLEALSPKAQEKLREWWIAHIKEGDLYIDLEDSVMISMINCCEDELEYPSQMPLLSIGQMIEFSKTQAAISGLKTESFAMLSGLLWIGHRGVAYAGRIAFASAFDCVVIGNIHQNPELLTSQQGSGKAG